MINKKMYKILKSSKINSLTKIKNLNHLHNNTQMKNKKAALVKKK